MPECCCLPEKSAPETIIRPMQIISRPGHLVLLNAEGFPLNSNTCRILCLRSRGACNRGSSYFRNLQRAFCFRPCHRADPLPTEANLLHTLQQPTCELRDILEVTVLSTLTNRDTHLPSPRYQSEHRAGKALPCT